MEKNDIRKAIEVAQEADDAFQAELQRLFGKHAGDRRHDATHRGWSPEAIDLGARFVDASEAMHVEFERARGEG